MAIMVADSEIICTEKCCGFLPTAQGCAAAAGFPLNLPGSPRGCPLVTLVTPRSGHFQTPHTLVLSLHVTGVSFIP
jgi:hypothetical protein